MTEWMEKMVEGFPPDLRPYACFWAIFMINGRLGALFSPTVM
jgi:hypothetical protein